MNAIHQIKGAGFTLELLPNNNIGVKPSTLNQQQRDYLTANKTAIVEHLQIEMIRAWLYKIGEPEEDHYLVLGKCRNDPESIQYFLKHARGEYKRDHAYDEQ